MSTVKTPAQRRKDRLVSHGTILLAEFRRLFIRHGYELKLADKDDILHQLDTLTEDLKNLDEQADQLAMHAWHHATGAASRLRHYATDEEMAKIDKILTIADE
jgi:hypothetical protein